MNNLKLMVNIRDIVYSEVRKSPAVDFTVGWEKRAEFRVIRRKALYFYESKERGDNYFVYLNGVRTTFLMKKGEIKIYFPNLIKHHTGNEIFF